VTISNPHNINEAAKKLADGAYGIRISLPEGDPFTHLFAENWSTLHWFSSASERDAALIDMRRKHEYSRPQDKPALDFAVVDRDDT